MEYSMPESEQKNTLEVHATESGQKLLQYLMRRLSLPQPLLHRWIRTGQVRVNGGRGKPFMHVQANDMIRLPPFALSMAQSATFDKKSPHAAEEKSAQDFAPSTTANPAQYFQEKQKNTLTPGAVHSAHAPRSTLLSASPVQPASSACGKAPSPLPLPPIVYEDANIILFNKPSGLPVHGGTGHSDSLCARLEQHFAHAPFKPTPAHRLDKDTSGLICVALSYQALRAAQEVFSNHSLAKEYVAWVHGTWVHTAKTPQLLTHVLGKKTVSNFEKVHVLSPSHKDARQTNKEDIEGKEAKSLVHCLARTPKYSLMHIRLITGRTHQIRVQLAAEGHSIVGDEKYNVAVPQHAQETQGQNRLLLHALRIHFPQSLDSTCLKALAGKEFAALPPWKKHFSVTSLPPCLCTKV